MRSIFDVSLNDKQLNWKHGFENRDGFSHLNITNSAKTIKLHEGDREFDDVAIRQDTKDDKDNGLFYASSRCKPRFNAGVSYSTFCVLISLICICSLHITVMPVLSPITIQIYIIIFCPLFGIFFVSSRFVKSHCYILHMTAVVVMLVSLYKNYHMMFITYAVITIIFASFGVHDLKFQTKTCQFAVFLALFVNLCLTVRVSQEDIKKESYSPVQYVMHISALFFNGIIYFYLWKCIAYT